MCDKRSGEEEHSELFEAEMDGFCIHCIMLEIVINRGIFSLKCYGDAKNNGNQR